MEIKDINAINLSIKEALNQSHRKNYVTREEFKIEMDAKNEAYYFILTHGLLDQFKEFCENYQSDDPHKDCIEYLHKEAGENISKPHKTIYPVC